MVGVLVWKVEYLGGMGQRTRGNGRGKGQKVGAILVGVLVEYLGRAGSKDNGGMGGAKVSHLLSGRWSTWEGEGSKDKREWEEPFPLHRPHP